MRSAAGKAAASEGRIPSYNELPDDIRREIPLLTIGGAMYSPTPSQRMLIVNSQVFHEGDQPYQGMVLEEIRLKSAVFSYRGHRYSVSY
ncbi:MAG: general secretion pathway protein GspB [Aquabacterium sp.]